MKSKWIVLLGFPYAVSVVPKEGKCIRYDDVNIAKCVEREQGTNVYMVDGLNMGESRELAHDLADLLNKAHMNKENASDTKDLPPSDEPKIYDDGAGKPSGL